jgi:gelsolin
MTVRLLLFFSSHLQIFTFFHMYGDLQIRCGSCTDLHGVPVQYREVQGFESSRFLSNFQHFTSLCGGVSTGFHHVSQAPPLDLFRLYRINASGTHLHVREVSPEASSLTQGAVFVLDKGTKVLQFNTKLSVGKEKFRAAEFVRLIESQRKGSCETLVYGE